MVTNKSPAKRLRSFKRLIKFILSKSSLSSPVLTVCSQSAVTILPVSQCLSISPLLPINVLPRLKTFSFTKQAITDIPPHNTTPENPPLNLPELLSKLENVQITVFELHRDHQEQLKLKNEEINVYRTALSTLGVPLPRL